MSEQKGNDNSSQRVHPFDRLMFGTRAIPAKVEESKVEESTPIQKNDLSNVVGNIDQIMATINTLKPLMKQISPLLNMFKSK